MEYCNYIRQAISNSAKQLKYLDLARLLPEFVLRMYIGSRFQQV